MKEINTMRDDMMVRGAGDTLGREELNIIFTLKFLLPRYLILCICVSTGQFM